MKLSELKKELKSPVRQDEDIELTGISIDSRKVNSGDLFVCIKGFSVDGHKYASMAVEKGAKALMVERWLDDIEVPQLLVKNCRSAWALAAALFFGKPSRSLKIIGITGTNGKTTVAHMITSILAAAGKKVAVMGTVGTFVNGKRYDQSLTTPDPMEFHELLRTIVDAGCEFVVMEVSAHALELKKVEGIRFETAVFTNLTQDHLDDFKTMEHYRDAKKKLFVNKMSMRAVINGDDDAARYMINEYDNPVCIYGIENKDAKMQASDVHVSADGVAFTIEEGDFCASVKMQLPGRFNAYNAMAAAATCRYAGVDWETIIRALEEIKVVDGRMESVDCGQPYKVFVDYAHTPDSLENSLKSVCEFAKKRVIVVFGCGGDRDKLKRSQMGKIAGQLADYSILTSDNPRTEDPSSIIDMIEEGIKDTNGRYERICDRKAAIEKALSAAQDGDVVLVAGKGHETYQDVMGQKHHFDDREIIREYIDKHEDEK